VDTDGNENTSVQCVGPVRSQPSGPIPAPITTLTAQDRPGDDGGAIDLDWSGYPAPLDCDHHNIYRGAAGFTGVSGMTPIGTVSTPSQMAYTDATTTDGTDYYYAVTCVDTDGNEDPSVTAVGPVQSVDNGAPAPVTTLTVVDVPGDAGRRVLANWFGYVPPPDFDHYRIYRALFAFSDVAGMLPIATNDDPAKTYRVLATGGDDIDYWYAVTCVDTDGNENTSVTAFGPVHSSPG